MKYATLTSVQNIAKNFRERASASWTFLIFSQASERELDNVFFSQASELARPLALKLARALARRSLAPVCSRASLRSRSLSTWSSLST